jgi:hypothetical protein
MAWSGRLKLRLLLLVSALVALVALCLGNLLYLPHTPLAQWYSRIGVGMKPEDVSRECPSELQMHVTGFAIPWPNSEWVISSPTASGCEEEIRLHYGPDFRVSRKEYLTGVTLRVRQWRERTFGW